MGGLQVLAARSDWGDGVCNEDLVGWLTDAVWILDGATGLGPPLLPHTSDAAWFVAAIDAALHGALSVAPDQPTPSVLREAVLQVRARFGQERLRAGSAAYESPSAAFAMVRRLAHGFELSTLGDCRIIYAPDDGHATTYGASRVSAFEAKTLAELAAILASNPELAFAQAKQLILPRLKQNRSRMNSSDGYWILGMDFAAIEHVQIRVLTSARLDCALATDGFTRLYDLFGLCTASDLLAAENSAAVDSLLSRLRAAETADPECRRYVRTKRSDDASFVRICGAVQNATTAPANSINASWTYERLIAR